MKPLYIALYFALGVVFGAGMVIAILPTGEPYPDLIKHGCGYYHPQTGTFTWKDSK